MEPMWMIVALPRGKMPDTKKNKAATPKSDRKYLDAPEGPMADWIPKTATARPKNAKNIAHP